MKSAFQVPRAARIPVACAEIGKEVKEAAQRVERGVNDAKAAVSEKLDDSVAAARRLLKRNRYTVEDGLEKTARNIKRHPFGTLAIGFAAGALMGLLVPRFGRK